MKRDLLIILAVNIIIELILVVGYSIALQNVQNGMYNLAEGQRVCLSDPARTTDCELEYDGDGSSSYPSDYAWYWQQ